MDQTLLASLGIEWYNHKHENTNLCLYSLLVCRMRDAVYCYRHIRMVAAVQFEPLIRTGTAHLFQPFPKHLAAILHFFTFAVFAQRLILILYRLFP